MAVIMDRETQRSRGFAFVEYTDPDSAQAAIGALNDVELDGRRLRVNAAEDRPRSGGGFTPRPGGGGGGGGGGGFSRSDDAPPPTFSRPKGSRRGLRGRKRSLGG